MRMRITNVNGHTTVENIESDLVRRILEIREMRKDSDERAKYRKAWIDASEFFSNCEERARVREILEREG